MIRKKRLFTPGPTPLLTRALAVDPADLPHHRQEEFRQLFRECIAGLKSIFKTESELLLLTSSGTGAMEAAVTNLLSPGDEVIVLSAGKFGERWEQLCAAFGLRVRALQQPYGESIEPEQVRKALEEMPGCRAVFVQACESSTGAAHDIRSLGALVAGHPRTLLIVDAITGLGTMPVDTDGWKLDVVIGGSQKAFMIPPGLAFLSLSPKALGALEQSRNPRFYFDLRREREQQVKGQTAFTPAVHLVRCLRDAVAYIQQIGIDALVENARRMAAITRAALAALEMPLVARHPADALTAAFTPPGISPRELSARLQQEFGLTLSGGQGALKGKIIRIAHLGYYDAFEQLALISCLEAALARLGHNFELGVATRAALQTYLTLEHHGR